MSTQIEAVIQRVERECREERIPMLGPEKARHLADLVAEASPPLAVECGTAVGYSALWFGRELLKTGGRLITLEINPSRHARARANIESAGLAEVVEARLGDARELLKAIKDDVAFLHLDNDYGNYAPCFEAIEPRLADGAIVAADNAGIGANGMRDYLERVRGAYESKTVWFELNLPWVKRDAIEISVYRKNRAQ
ncbi:MAG: class I SAM-dependent methyltransferase [Candidatus Poribacteria bacterium]|nr:class I SAM-dependent methyltransferase [Candidatus Poribacteria bacterium]